MKLDLILSEDRVTLERDQGARDQGARVQAEWNQGPPPPNDLSERPGDHESPPFPAELRLADVPLRQVVELVRIESSDEEMLPLLERGVLPGCQLCPIRRSPAGDPIVMVEGSLLALRQEMAGCLCVRPSGRRTD